MDYKKPFMNPEKAYPRSIKVNLYHYKNTLDVNRLNVLKVLTVASYFLQKEKEAG